MVGKRRDLIDAKRVEIARSLLMDVPKSIEDASQRFGYKTPTGFTTHFDRKDPAPFFRKYGGELATDERVQQVCDAFQKGLRGPGGYHPRTFQKLRFTSE